MCTNTVLPIKSKVSVANREGMSDKQQKYYLFSIFSFLLKMEFQTVVKITGKILFLLFKLYHRFIKSL